MEEDFERLKAHLLPLSQSQEFECARKEWKLIAIEISEEGAQCPCGQEVLEHCLMRNYWTGRATFVGSDCVKQYIGLQTEKLFKGLNRIRQDLAANPNEELIRHAQEAGCLYGKEFDFLMDTKLKRKWSPKQLEWKEKIHRRILERMIVQRRSRADDAFAALRKRVTRAMASIKREDG